jgi:hypothetical protein
MTDKNQSEDATTKSPPISDKKRQQITDILGISISPSRCSTYLKQYLYNEEIETEIKALREQLKSVTNDTEKANIKAKLLALIHKIIRISSETYISVAVICNNFVEDLIKKGIDNAISNNKKVVEISSIMTADYKQCPYYSIYSKLPLFVNYDSKNYDDVKKETSKRTKKVKEEEPTEVQSDNQTEAQTDNQSDVQNKFTFNNYVDAIFKSLKKTAKYEDVKIRISSDVRDFLSNVVIECIKRFVVLSKIISHNLVNIRTMNANYIKTIIIISMTDGGNSQEQIDSVINSITDKLTIYQEHLKNEKINRYNELTDEIKKQMLEKQQERIANRKKLEVVLAEKRANTAMERFKKLSTEKV